MNYIIRWKKSETQKETIIGICPELPDNFCHFSIRRISPEKFTITLPGYFSENHFRQLIFRDPEIARTFCLDYLHHNLNFIIQNQISEMKRRSYASIKPISYYENQLLNYKSSYF